jgi:manganese/zinc/iron transport system permease protein
MSYRVEAGPAVLSWPAVSPLIDALLFQAGYNTAVVTAGAALLGAGAGAVGVFVLLRGRALVSDAISHATLPGVVLAFIVGVLVTGEGRHLPVLMLGAGLSALAGVLAVAWIAARTRLPEDAAIGTVLSTFFALGVVLLTVVQSMPAGGQAGLEGFLLGATAGMLRSEALFIAGAAASVFAAVLALQKELGLVAFDPDYAAARGYDVHRLDLVTLGLLLAIVVIGLSTVGLILIIALAIIPPVAARLWTERLVPMVLIAALIGGAGSHLGAAISSTAPRLPTGAIIVLTLFALFCVSLALSPVRGLVAWSLRHWRFRRIVHERQGLLALARGEPVFDPFTRRLLRLRRYIRRSGEPTPAGLAAASAMARDQALWNRYREAWPDEAAALADWSLKPIEDVLPADLVAVLEGGPGPEPVEGRE